MIRPLLHTLCVLLCWPLLVPAAVPPVQPDLAAPLRFQRERVDAAWHTAVTETGERRERALRDLRACGELLDADREWLVRKALPALRPSSAPEREAALEILIGLGNRAETAKPALFSAVAEEKALDGRRSAIDALLAVGITTADYPKVRELLKRELPPETQRYLRAALGEEGPALSTAAQEALARLRAHEIDPVALWNHPDPRVREEAVDAFAAIDIETVLKVRPWLSSLRDSARPVRAAGVRQLAGVPPKLWLSPALALLSARSDETRAAVCELLEAAAPNLTASAALVRARLIAAIRQYPQGRENWQHSLASAWRAIGIADADKVVLHRLLKDRKLGPARRAQLIRLADSPEFVTDLMRIADEDPRAIPVARQWERTGIDGDLTAVWATLKALTPQLAPAEAHAVQDRLTYVMKIMRPSS